MSNLRYQEWSDEYCVQHRLPIDFDPNEEILPGVRYGQPDELLTPAYWVMRCKVAQSSEKSFVSQHGSLREEVGFCLLGGYGVTLEVADAFFQFLKKQGVFRDGAETSRHDILRMLLTPIDIDGSPRKYRFPQQRAHRLHEAMQRLDSLTLELKDPVQFRDQIQSLNGVGPKTASWIARNWLDTDNVAILDIHVLRAGWAINLFDLKCKLPQDYSKLEYKFIVFAKTLQVRASELDAIMWSDMRKFGSRLVREAKLTIC